MQRDELSAWLRLSLTPGVGNETARKLLAAFGLPPAIFRQPAAALGQVVSRAQAIELQKTPPELNNLVEVTWAWLQAAPTAGAGSNDKTVQSAPPEHRQIVVLGDANYPASLLNIEDPPLMLYLLCAGGVPEADFFSRSCLRSIAVVGSRNPTPQGLETAHQFSRALRESGLTWRESEGGRSPASGKSRTFVLTGSLETMTRDDARAMIEGKGHREPTQVLPAGHHPSPKTSTPLRTQLTIAGPLQ